MNSKHSTSDVAEYNPQSLSVFMAEFVEACEKGKDFDRILECLNPKRKEVEEL